MPNEWLLYLHFKITGKKRYYALEMFGLPGEQPDKYGTQGSNERKGKES